MKKIIIICGHYGSGKTNFALNLAFDLKEEGQKILVVDMDVVNPYFVSSGYKDILDKKGIEVLSSVYANTNLDSPAIPASFYGAFSHDGYVICDMGGDDAGATIMGGFSDIVKTSEYSMLYVINKNRALTSNAHDAKEMLDKIQTTSKLKATGIVNNTHLQQLTTLDMIKDSAAYAKQVCTLTGLDMLYTTVPEFILDDNEKDLLGSGIQNPYPVKIYVKKPWEDNIWR